MKQFTLFLIFILTTMGSVAQEDLFFRYDGPRPVVINANGDTLTNPFAGGMRNPQFSTIHLNSDTLEDLVVFDRMDNHLGTFVNTGQPGQIRYRYAPEYETRFPALVNMVQLVDYNRDGKKDIMAYSSFWGAGLEVYKNVSDTMLKFQLITQQLLYNYGNGYSNLFISPVDIPSIIDIDFDGDIDVLSFGILGGYVYWYENLAADKNYSPDSLTYVRSSKCWGKFRESNNSNNLILGETCGSGKKKKHTGSNIMAYDADGDKDMELLLGDVSFDNIVYAHNGMKENNHYRDTMTSYVYKFPSNTSAVDITEFPATYHLDVNNDGRKDLLVSPQDPNGWNETINQVWYYENTGSGKNQVFTYRSNDFLQSTMIDLGSGNAPSFFDFDADGDQDMFIATRGDYATYKDSADRLVLYENKGTDSFPVYEFRNNDYLSLLAEKIIHIHPAFGDIDGDGDADLLLGTSDGTLMYFENTAGSGNTASFTLKGTVFDSIDVGWNAAPVIADVDGDLLNDLVIGEQSGNLNYYKNASSGGTVDFRLVTDSFGGINNLSNCVPAIADLDRNGYKDLVIGADYGALSFYMDFDTALTGRFLPSHERLFDTLTRRGQKARLGGNLVPAIANMSQDTFPDLMVGTIRGGMVFLRNTFSIEDTSGNPTIHEYREDPYTHIRIYPNPSRDFINIQVMDAGLENLRMDLLNVLGKSVLTTKLRNDRVQQRVSLYGLTPGIYLVTIIGDDGSILLQSKLVVNQ